MSTIFMFIGVVLAGLIIAASLQPQARALRTFAWALAAIVLIASFTLASFRYVGEDVMGVVSKNIGFKSLPPGKIIATEGEKGPQAAILPPGWHPWYWPFIYDIDMAPITMIPEGQVGLLSTSDGLPLPPDSTFAPEWDAADVGKMAGDATYFLTEGKGHKGPQSTVLPPGKYRINPKLFTVEIKPTTTIEKATVGVVKSNVGETPKTPAAQLAAGADHDVNKLVENGKRGIWKNPYLPGQKNINPNAFQVTPISSMTHVVQYTLAQGQRAGIDEESEIMVRTSDGFTFPVDVRLEYSIQPQDAPLVVAMFGDDKELLRAVMNSDVRGIFRNNAENMKALDYVKQRSVQEEQCKKKLQEVLSKKGITVVEVRIGDVGDENSLGPLLKTQTNREIAVQEQETYKQQQLTAMQKKELSRTEQEAEEEKRLATASYAVKISEQDKLKVIIAAGAEAESIKIKGEAQAAAYAKIAEQIGQGNAALVEILKIVGERNIEITPRVMVTGGGTSGKDSQTTALIGTMLDSMVEKSPAASNARAAK